MVMLQKVVKLITMKQMAMMKFSMRRSVTVAISALAALLLPLLSPAQRNDRADSEEFEKPELSIECRLATQDFYERQPVAMVLTLVSSTPNIQFADPVSLPKLKKGSFDTFQTITPAGNAYEEKVGGKTRYCFPLNAYMITLADKGKYELEGGEYRVGVYFPVVVRDPFWGSRRSRKVVDYTVSVEKESFKVKGLPPIPDNIDFSGSVGEFTIETVVPPGDIFLDEEATAYVILRGSGMIAESTLPEYRDAFKDGVKLKSVTESRDEGHADHKMMSEIRLECTFIPTERDNAWIGEATFDYFNPVTKKYETARSKPVKVNVKSSTARRDSMSI